MSNIIMAEVRKTRREIEREIEQSRKDAWERINREAKEFKKEHPEISKPPVESNEDIMKANIDRAIRARCKDGENLSGRPYRSKNKLLDMSTG